MKTEHKYIMPYDPIEIPEDLTIEQCLCGISSLLRGEEPRTRTINGWDMVDKLIEMVY